MLDRLEPQHREFGRFQVAEQRAFGEFELQLVGIELGFPEDAFDQIDEIRAAKLQR